MQVNKESMIKGFGVYFSRAQNIFLFIKWMKVTGK